MKRFAPQVLRYVTLIAVTVGAAFVMWWVSRRSAAKVTAQFGVSAPLSAAAQPKALVAAETLQPETVELTATFTGKVRPWETYTLAFEVPGRVVALGTRDDGQPLDDGDRVAAGQMLARMDDRIFAARKSEAIAQLEEATTEMRRIRNLRERLPEAITDTEFQEQLTRLALARAGQEVALKNLDDAVLSSPVDATISRRLINAGESVQANQAAFELVQNSEVLLVVDVPESQVYELQDRMQELRAAGRNGPTTVAPFRAYVALEGRDRFGGRLPELAAEVYRIAQVADPTTGLFEVEIRVPNKDRNLRAGMVATARIVIDTFSAYRVPETAVMFRGREAFVFAVDDKTVPLEVMFWDAGDTLVHQVRRVEISRWIEQGADVIVPAEDLELSHIVVRGQQRLADGQLVRLVDPQQTETIEAPPAATAHAVPADAAPATN